MSLTLLTIRRKKTNVFILALAKFGFTGSVHFLGAFFGKKDVKFFRAQFSHKSITTFNNCILACLTHYFLSLPYITNDILKSVIFELNAQISDGIFTQLKTIFFLFVQPIFLLILKRRKLYLDFFSSLNLSFLFQHS